MGANTLLIDEDTCATNFMIRDSKMMRLVAPDKEPITPFVHVVRSLYDDSGISSILVIGGVGDYFDVADTCVMMDCYKCLDVTERAKAIVANSTPFHGDDLPDTKNRFAEIRHRYPLCKTFHAQGKVKVLSRGSVLYGETELDLSALEQLVTKSQTAAVANILQRLPSLPSGSVKTLPEVLRIIDELIDEEGLHVLTPNLYHGAMSRPRPFEVAGAINRIRREPSITQEPDK